MISPIERKPKESGGGLLGAIGGLAKTAGLIASVIPGGQAIGAGLAAGGQLASSITPSKVSDGRNVNPLQSKANDPGVQLAQMHEFDAALNKSGAPENERSLLMQHSDMAKQALMKRLGRA